MSSRSRNEAETDHPDFSLRSQPRVLDPLFQLGESTDRLSLKRGARRGQNCCSPIPFEKFNPYFIFQRSWATI